MFDIPQTGEMRRDDGGCGGVTRTNTPLAIIDSYGSGIIRR